MYKSIKLKNVVEYSNERVNINQISIDNYVSTDNLLANKQGVTKALGLPPKSDKLPAFNAENILVANIRPYLKKIWFANKDGACSPDVLTFKVKDGFLPEFVYYALFRDDFFDHVMKGSKGTKMPRGDKNQILDFTIPFLTLDNQENITALLSILDAKIAINQKINKELESIIPDLYDFWFLHGSYIK
jgi:type I restriction enzyme S subunit